jgi:hypothetical protein
MSNAEWAAIAHWCRKSGHFPRGNNNFGRDFFAAHEHGAAASRSEGEDRHVERTLTGGADAWSHDGSPFGIFDMNGNVWDYVSGLRAVDGEIQIIEDNNSALNIDEGPSSPLWRAIDMDGGLVAPGSANTYKFDGVNPGREDDADVTIPGGVELSFEVRNPHYTGGGDSAHCAFTFMPFKAMAAAGGAAPHIMLKQLGVYPAAQDIGDAMFFIRNYGERMACRGGSWFDGAAGGLWDLYMRETREFLYPDIGFRSAYVI